MQQVIENRIPVTRKLHATHNDPCSQLSALAGGMRLAAELIQNSIEGSGFSYLQRERVVAYSSNLNRRLRCPCDWSEAEKQDAGQAQISERHSCFTRDRWRRPERLRRAPKSGRPH